MHFELAEDHKLLQDLVARFVRESLMPLEQKVLERDASGNGQFLLGRWDEDWSYDPNS